MIIYLFDVEKYITSQIKYIAADSYCRCYKNWDNVMMHQYFFFILEN